MHKDKTWTQTWIRLLNKRLPSARIDPATHRAHWFWHGGLNYSTKYEVSINKRLLHLWKRDRGIYGVERRLPHTTTRYRASVNIFKTIIIFIKYIYNCRRPSYYSIAFYYLVIKILHQASVIILYVQIILSILITSHGGWPSPILQPH